jgi:hypothetical protein
MLAPEPVVEVLARESVGVESSHRQGDGQRQQQPGAPKQWINAQGFQLSTALVDIL